MERKKTQKLKNYYKDLPQGYVENYCIDAKKSSFLVAFNFISLLLMAVVGVVTYFIRFGTRPLYDEEVGGATVAIALAIIVIGYLLYLVVHELTHGICYKALTKQKLKFGLTMYVAYCGLREGFVNKKTAIISVLAPFVVHSIWMILAIFLIAEPLISLAFLVLFAMHFGGCVGDLWVTVILIFKYREKAVLMCNNGPCQRFYIYDPESAVFTVPAAGPVSEEVELEEENAEVKDKAEENGD